MRKPAAVSQRVFYLMRSYSLNMGVRFILVPVAAVTLALSGCSVTVEPTASPSQTQSATPTIDPTLIPSASPTELTQVDPSTLMSASGDFLFKVGSGPTWCTIVSDGSEVVCEMNEADALYKPVPVPDSCNYSYGYQISLLATASSTRDEASFVCAGGYYSDPNGAATLNSGESVTVAPFTCFVQEVTARCENADGKFIALGPKAWALGN